MIGQIDTAFADMQMSRIGGKRSFIPSRSNRAISVSVDAVDIDNRVFAACKRPINDLRGLSFCFLRAIGWVNDLSVTIVLTALLFVVFSAFIFVVFSTTLRRGIISLIFITTFWRGDNV